MYPPLRQAEWIKFIGLLITSENFCTLKIQKKFGDAFYPRTLTHWLKPLIHHSYRCEGKRLLSPCLVITHWIISG